MIANIYFIHATPNLSSRVYTLSKTKGKLGPGTDPLPAFNDLTEKGSGCVPELGLSFVLTRAG